MPTIRVSVTTSLSVPDAVRRLIDFGPSRADAWANVNSESVRVHDQGPNWADVTEGNRLAWERERYDWDAEAGTVSSVTTDSNLWQSGPAWDYRVTAQPGGGSIVEVTAQRDGKGVKGKLVAVLLSIIGTRMIKSSTARALRS